jgi:hypothetical protein
MSMAPSIWIVNFVAVYTLNPVHARSMDADSGERRGGH